MHPTFGSMDSSNASRDATRRGEARQPRRGEAAQAARSVPCSKICKSNRTTMPGPTLPPLTADDVEDAGHAGHAEHAEHAKGLGSAGDARRGDAR
jgi:hypothetical protein